MASWKVILSDQIYPVKAFKLVAEKLLLKVKPTDKSEYLVQVNKRWKKEARHTCTSRNLNITSLVTTAIKQFGILVYAVLYSPAIKLFIHLRNLISFIVAILRLLCLSYLKYMTEYISRFLPLE